MLQEQPKTFIMWKEKGQLITVIWGFKKCCLCCKNLKSQVQFGQKLWIPRPCSKSQKQIWQVALREYQANSASHCVMWFVTFTISAKISGATELYLSLAKILQNFWFTQVKLALLLKVRQYIHNFSVTKFFKHLKLKNWRNSKFSIW